jgi:fucose 4-O-acetylase-like acetyltransferase
MDNQLNLSNKSRLPYIDIAKGILILFVIIGHMKVFSQMLNVDNEVYRIYGINYLWNGFFMQAFFFITGYCSTFKRNWGGYIYGNIKGIIVPLICVSFIIQVLQLFWGIRHNTFADWERGFINLSLRYWFLNAIFLAKVMYFPISRLSPKNKIVLSLVVYLLGFCMWKYDILPNIWFFKHAFMLLPFMTAGEILRYHTFTKKHFLLFFLAYLFTSLSLLLMGFEQTIIAFDIHLNWNNLVQALIIGTCGTIVLLSFCKMLGNCKVLEYIGRNTLVIFMFHLFSLPKFLVIMKPITDWCAPIGWCTVFFFTVISCMIFVYILNLKPFRWTLGKY